MKTNIKFKVRMTLTKLTKEDIKFAGKLYDSGEWNKEEYLEILDINLFPEEITDKLFLKPTRVWLLNYKVQLEFEAEDELRDRSNIYS